MTEKEKMLTGKMYIASGEELTAERLHAKELLSEFNALPPSEQERRNVILKQLLGKTEAQYYIEPPFRCDYGYNITIGKNFYANYNCTILDCAKIEIGDHVLLGPNVSLFTAGHPLEADERIKGLEYAYPITIGNNVWIGGGTIINPGITIGDNSIIGSGSIVTKDIPANVVAAGNPCRIIRKLDNNEDDKTQSR
ncbi:sugar O-acetyltransferase [uncultured Sanguibacteroides sp.]|uniref:sugar O-acetyltransferase n=1 Tax=uncultured Sanguibacteroides sp. TaxID=1635151 RepID=UPI0025E72B0B|nr:sugar O-acetyltransferase [uncultured Sanguibacteroides sp.]